MTELVDTVLNRALTIDSNFISGILDDEERLNPIGNKINKIRQGKTNGFR